MARITELNLCIDGLHVTIEDDKGERCLQCTGLVAPEPLFSLGSLPRLENSLTCKRCKLRNDCPGFDHCPPINGAVAQE